MSEFWHGTGCSIQGVVPWTKVSVCFDFLSLSVSPDPMNTEDPPSARPWAAPPVGLRGVLAWRRLAERIEAEQVAGAGEQGWWWQQIAEGRGMTRQSVHAKY